MSTSTLVLTVDAVGSTDAQDIAKRRAREDGWRIKTIRTVHPAPTFSGDPRVRGPWVVELAVVRP